MLSQLYNSAESGHLTLWTLPDKITYWYDPQDTITAYSDAERMSAEGKEVYFGLGLRARKLPNNQRGGSQDVSAITCLWADFDIADDTAHAATNLPTYEQAMQFIQRLPIEPSIIVHSGHGLHLYWMLRECWTFDKPDERAEAAGLLTGWQAFIRQMSGYQVDGTHDLARVLRVPGTINHKSNPVPVRVIHESDAKYNPSDFQEYQAVIAPTDIRPGGFKRLPGDGDASIILDKCQFCARLRSPAGITEPEWFAANSNIVRGVGGEELIHELARQFLGDKYNREKTAKKIRHALDGTNPQSCSYINRIFPGICPIGGCGVKAPVAFALKRKPKKQKTDDTEPPQLEKLTDLGNAERFARLNGEKLRYCYAFSNWLVWDGSRHRIDDTGQVMEAAKQTIRSLYTDAAQIGNEDVRNAVLKHAKKSESAAALKAMLLLSQHMLAVSVDELDADIWLLNVKNGVIDLKTGKILPPDPKRILTKLAPVVYDPKATAPRFEQFLTEIFPCQPDLIKSMQRWLGYSLTGCTNEQKLAICYGPAGGNGKGTLLNLVRDILGDYSEVTPAETFLAKRTEGIPNDLARLRGARFVLASETESGKRLNEPLVKAVTGQDKITARFLRCEFFTFEPQFKLNLLTNHKPAINGDDAALGRRLMLIPFMQQFREKNKDATLGDKLRREMSGVLNWLLQGCLEWQRNGLQESAEITAATRDYRNEYDVIQQFFDEKCVINSEIIVTTSCLYNCYVDFARENNLRNIMTKIMFTKKIRDKNCEVFRGSGNIQKIKGIGILADLDDKERPY